MTALNAGIAYDDALALLKEHNKEAFHIEHGEVVGETLRAFAREFDPENAEFWAVVGLLHDLDWEEFPTPEQHTIAAEPILRAAGGTDELVHAIQSHNSDFNPACPAPELFMEKVLFAVDELTGLIGAAVLMRPSKSVMDFSVKSLKKKFKDTRFAAGCSRDVIRTGPSCADGSSTSCSSVLSPPCSRSRLNGRRGAPSARRLSHGHDAF